MRTDVLSYPHEVVELRAKDRDQLQHSLAYVETGPDSWLPTSYRHGDYRFARAPLNARSYRSRLGSCLQERKQEQPGNPSRVADQLVQCGIGWSMSKIVKACGSEINDRCPKFLTLLADPKIGQMVVEHKDQASRFGVAYLQTVLARPRAGTGDRQHR
jgi:hypothetical protein